MKKIVLMMFGLLAMVNIVSAQTLTNDPKALQILDAMSDKYQKMTSFKASFTYTLESPNGKQTATGEIIVRGTKFHIKMGKQEIINNGTTVWTILHDQKEVNISDYEPDETEITPTKIYTIYKKGYKYQFIEEKTDAAGKAYEVVELQPDDRKNQFFKIRIEVYKKDRTIKSWKIFEKNGNKYDYVIKTFTPDFPVQDSYFNYDKSKYPGYKEIDLR